MIVQLFNYGKKKNSTSRPAGATGTLFTNVQLKEETSTTKPVLLFNPSSDGLQPFFPSKFNYAYLPTFLRFYYIDDWVFVNGLWECYLRTDVLASFHDAIGETTCYVERAASRYDGSIIDNLYPAKTDIQITSATIATGWANVAPSGGCYVLGIINYQPANHIGAITYYALTSSELNSLLEFLFSNNIFNAGSITEVGVDMFKALFNPFQYIVSCMWLPAPASHYGSTQTTIKVGYWDTNVTAISVTALIDRRYVEGTVPAHPQAASRGDFLNYAPYTRVTLFCPPFGEVPIDPSFMRIGHNLYSRVDIDTITGLASLRVSFRANAAHPYSNMACIEKTAMMGVPIQLAQVMSDYSNAMNSAIGGFSGGIAGAIMGMIGATVQSAISTQAPKVSTSGANGSFINFAMEPELVVEHTLLVDEDLADLGRPLMSPVKLNTLSGYIKCAEAHFAGTCFDSEKDAINQFLIDGFYYE